ncbi:hypothetical protein VSH64_09755 [Amycolatopsis rhabdoformis]|uniref:Uncharacterized protein n=1 Tax=Amycolatopsis rhabdoformis TaxID=1448059 RepID=A0ABZ1IEP5_9PSEU|nr:hypothetical protein [Amycolatopsis rhabdoformis]WSE32387.1 hypothetical protein VSH64_09755 [Amycolatopsis rhabdoformis]
MTDAINGKAVLRLPRLVARVDRAMATVAVAQSVLVLVSFVLLGLLARGAPLLESLLLVVFGVIGTTIGTVRHFRVAARDGAVIVIGSAAGAFVVGVLWHFVLGGPGNIHVALRSGAPVLARFFEAFVTLHLVAAAATVLLAGLAFRRRTAILAIGRITE